MTSVNFDDQSKSFKQVYTEDIAISNTATMDSTQQQSLDNMESQAQQLSADASTADAKKKEQTQTIAPQTGRQHLFQFQDWKDHVMSNQQFDRSVEHNIRELNMHILNLTQIVARPKCRDH